MSTQTSTTTSLKSQEHLPAGIDEEKLSNSTRTEQEHVPEKREIRGWRWLLVLVGLYATALLYGLDTTITADVQAAVLSSLGQLPKLGWLGIGFPMGSAATILPIGVSYGLFNIKWLYIASIILFELGSALCGAAPTMTALIVGRVIAGIGGAGMYLG
jgi:MFS family permease